MPKVSVVIPTYNRPELLSRAISSVLAQTYEDWEMIIVDDCPDKPAEESVRQFNEPRIKYIKHKINKGGAAARNTGIGVSRGEFIAFLDDDDEWLPEKLETQMSLFEKSAPDVGFCFCAVMNVYENKQEASIVPEGVADYHEFALRRLKGFLTVTLVIKRRVFNEIGCFDENFPSHQEPDLMIRVTKKFKGLGVNKPMVLVNMKKHDQVGGNLKRKIAGREMIVKKYLDEYAKYPKILARQYFQLGIYLRDDGQAEEAGKYFKKSWQICFKFRYLFHYLRSLI